MIPLAQNEPPLSRGHPCEGGPLKIHQKSGKNRRPWRFSRHVVGYLALIFHQRKSPIYPPGPGKGGPKMGPKYSLKRPFSFPTYFACFPLINWRWSLISFSKFVLLLVVWRLKQIWLPSSRDFSCNCGVTTREGGISTCCLDNTRSFGENWQLPTDVIR